MRIFPFRKREGLTGVFLTGLALACATSESWVPVEDGRLVMGTPLDIALLVRAGEEERARAQIGRAFDSAVALEGVASRWISSSDVSELNRRAGEGAVPIDPSLYALLQRAEDAREATGGAFDARVGPLVALWTDAGERGVLPSDEALAAAQRRVHQRVTLSNEGDRHYAFLASVGMSIDLGGIAKGFALDRIAVDLRAAGFARGLLSFGQSSVWALGRPVGAQRFRLAVRDDSGNIVDTVSIADQALSVSSSWGRSSETLGRRYSHVIDPRTGMALSHGRRAVVVARDATLAEVLSTALLVLDAGEGRAVVDAQAAEARVVSEDGSEWETPGWSALRR